MEQLALPILPAAAPTFENFEAGPNTEAVAVAHALAAGSAPASSVLFWGPPGSGKAHLLAALAHAQPRHHWLMPGRMMGLEFARAGPSESPLLLLTRDPHTWDEADQQALFVLYNRLRTRGDLALVITAPQPPDGLPMREDLRTRMAAGLVVGLKLLSDDDKKAALHRHARSRGLRPNEAVVDWLLAHRDRDIRSLVAWLDALDRHALATRRPLSLSLLQDLERKGGRPGSD